MASPRKLWLQLFVDKENNQVVFAESNKDFIGILFSILTLPLGTITRLVSRKLETLGCFYTLYDSIDNLETGCFNSEACRNMLLEPRSESEAHCHYLKLSSGSETSPSWRKYMYKFGQAEVLRLLERSLLSNNPLSEVFLGCMPVKDVHDEHLQAKITKFETDASKESNQIELKLIVNKDNEDVLYVQVKDDFIDLLCSFLTFPLGSIVKLLDGCSTFGCADN